MNPTEGLPIWRSMLFMPVNVDRFVDKAHLLEVDAIQLDLEDSVAPSDKESARKLVAAAAGKAARGGADIIVRINRPLGLAIRDIEASVSANVQALNLPKIHGRDHIRLLSEYVADVEGRAGMEIGKTKFIVTIETPEAWFKLQEICSADPRIVAAVLGGEDFAAATGMTTAADVMSGPKQALVIAAAAAGIVPMGTLGSIADFNDMEGYRTMVRRSKTFGFRGASCVHPRQAQILNEEFRPSESEITWARTTIERFESSNSAAVGEQGQMIDLPIAMRAQSLLSWHNRVELRKQPKA